MQQSYRALRIIAEAQTIRIVLAPEPDELMLNELCILCDSLHTESSSGIKAVVLDFNPTAAQLVAHSSQVTTDRVAPLASPCWLSSEPRSRNQLVNSSRPLISRLSQKMLNW